VNEHCLWRHIASVTTEKHRKPTDDNTGGALSRETVFIAQQQDAHCKELITDVRAGTEPGYLTSEDGLLYVGFKREHARLVVPAELKRSIIELRHDKVFAGHQGVKRTCDLVKLYYFWPNMNQDIDLYVKQCDSCAKFKAGRQATGELPETIFSLEMRL
jgi:hypothetical protein